MFKNNITNLNDECFETVKIFKFVELCDLCPNQQY